MKVIVRLWIGLLMLLLSSCARPCGNYRVEGADQFVCDSYTIGAGKLAIMEMSGKANTLHYPRALQASDFAEYQDVIVEGDRLNITVYHPTRGDLMHSIERLNGCLNGFCVTRGMVQLLDLPAVEVAGLCLEEAQALLQRKLSEQLEEVALYVSYRERPGRQVELNGLVGVAVMPVDGKMRLYELLAKARIAPNANLFMSYVLRDGCPLAIDLYKLLNEGDMSQNIVMRPRDKIFIANTDDAHVLVMGEVRAPRSVPLPYGSMSLREALVAAGGIPFTGDRNHIQVIRGNLPCPRVYALCWEHILYLPNDALLLMPGDTVYVSAKPITEWNRFIEQLLPSLRCFHECGDCYGIIGN